MLQIFCTQFCRFGFQIAIIQPEFRKFIQSENYRGNNKPVLQPVLEDTVPVSKFTGFSRDFPELKSKQVKSFHGND